MEEVLTKHVCTRMKIGDVKLEAYSGLRVAGSELRVQDGKKECQGCSQNEGQRSRSEAVPCLSSEVF